MHHEWLEDHGATCTYSLEDWQEHTGQVNPLLHDCTFCTIADHEGKRLLGVRAPIPEAPLDSVSYSLAEVASATGESASTICEKGACTDSLEEIQLFKELVGEFQAHCDAARTTRDRCASSNDRSSTTCTPTKGSNNGSLKRASPAQSDWGGGGGAQSQRSTRARSECSFGGASTCAPSRMSRANSSGSLCSAMDEDEEDELKSLAYSPANRRFDPSMWPTLLFNILFLDTDDSLRKFLWPSTKYGKIAFKDYVALQGMVFGLVEASFTTTISLRKLQGLSKSISDHNVVASNNSSDGDFLTVLNRMFEDAQKLVALHANITAYLKARSTFDLGNIYEQISHFEGSLDRHNLEMNGEMQVLKVWQPTHPPSS